MEKTTPASKRPLKTLLIIIFFVYADIICENFLVIVNDQQEKLLAHILLFGLLIFQIVFSPLQSGFSDFYGRKKSLIISLSISLISTFLIFVFVDNILSVALMLIIATTIKGIWGNTIPIAFAAIADTQSGDYRGSFALASSTYSLAFITLIIVHQLSFSDTFLIYIVGVILILSLIVCFLQFGDSKDRTAHLPYKVDVHNESKLFSSLWKIGKKEVSLIKQELLRTLTTKVLLAYLLWEISMYSILVSEVDFYRGKSHNFALSMMIGYLVGIFILKLKPCKKVKDSTMIKWGYFFSFYSLIPYFLLFWFIRDNNYLLGICYFFHAFGNALLSPTIITILAKKRPSHDQGKILGLMESADTIAFLFSTISVMIFIFFKFPVFVLIVFSFVSFSISWIFYKTFSNEKKLEEMESHH